jgi:predicted phage baseplate assembly protein
MVFRCDIAGVGVQPDWPPLVWEAWDGDDWRECPVDRDETGGLNQDGMVVIHLPRAHLMSTLSGRRAGWIRVRITEPEPDQPMYEGSPTITEVSVSIVGGTVDAANAELVDEEDLGPAEGIPGQRWELRRRPLVPGDTPPVLEVSTEDGWQEWTLESDFASSGPEDRHFVLDVAEGSVSLGPGVRLADGTFRRYGAVPAKGARARLRHFRTGGGERGNVSAGTLSVLKSSIPYVARVENRRAAQGGVDGEGIENAKRRAPVALRTRGRAVTTEDFEHLAREAAPEAARIRAVQATDPSDAGAVRVLVVPFVAAEAGRVSFDQLVPADETLQAVTDRLEECRIIGTRVLVEPPLYRGVTVEARLHARARANPVRVQSAALDAVFAYLNPITGGPEKAGWPFGRAVNVGEIYGVLQGIPGTEVVDDVRIFPSDPVTGARGGAVNRLVLEPNAIVFSHEHRVDVEGG